MSSLEPTLQARLEAFIDFKVKHPRLEEMDRDLMRRISWAQEVHDLGHLWGNWGGEIDGHEACGREAASRRT